MECKLNNLPHGHMHGHRLLDHVAPSDKGQSSLIFGSEKKINEVHRYR